MFISQNALLPLRYSININGKKSPSRSWTKAAYVQGLTLKIICKYSKVHKLCSVIWWYFNAGLFNFFSATLEVQEALGPRVCQKTAEQQRIYDSPFEQIMTEVIKESV